LDVFSLSARSYGHRFAQPHVVTMSDQFIWPNNNSQSNHYPDSDSDSSDYDHNYYWDYDDYDYDYDGSIDYDYDYDYYDDDDDDVNVDDYGHHCDDGDDNDDEDKMEICGPGCSIFVILLSPLTPLRLIIFLLERRTDILLFIY
jgi:hypothetical protein